MSNDKLNTKEIAIKTLCHFMYYFQFIMRKQDRPIVLYYHSVFEQKKGDSNSYNLFISISQDLFEEQIRYLSRKANVISLDEYTDYFLGNRRVVAPNSILITFDDGYRDNFSFAYPVLRKYGLPATIFLTLNMIGSTSSFWWDDLYELFNLFKNIDNIWEVADAFNWRQPFSKNDIATYKEKSNYFKVLNERLKSMDEAEKKFVIEFLKNILKKNNKNFLRDFLSWDEVREMSDRGISFGSHSCSHSNLSLLSKEKVTEEVSLSKKIIEHNIGKKVFALSYPYGYYNEQCKSAVQAAGYKIAFTTKSNNEKYDRFCIPRIPIKHSRSIGITGKFSPHLFCIECGGFFERLSAWKRSWLRENITI